MKVIVAQFTFGLGLILLPRTRSKGVWLIYELPGLRLIWEKLVSPSLERPSSLAIWIIGVYTALFGIASQRYENAADRVELRANAVVALLANDNFRIETTAQIAEVQQMLCPIQPDYFSPATVINSFFGETGPYQPGIDYMVKAVEGIKGKLNKANLRGSVLHSAKLSGVQLRGSDLRRVQLQGAFLKEANFQDANMNEAQLQGAILWKAWLQ